MGKTTASITLNVNFRRIIFKHLYGRTYIILKQRIYKHEKYKICSKMQLLKNANERYQERWSEIERKTGATVERHLSREYRKEGARVIKIGRRKRGLKGCYGLKGLREVGINGAITAGNVSCRKGVTTKSEHAAKTRKKDARRRFIQLYLAWWKRAVARLRTE